MSTLAQFLPRELRRLVSLFVRYWPSTHRGQRSATRGGRAVVFKARAVIVLGARWRWLVRSVMRTCIARPIGRSSVLIKWPHLAGAEPRDVSGIPTCKAYRTIVRRTPRVSDGRGGPGDGRRRAVHRLLETPYGHTAGHSAGRHCSNRSIRNRCSHNILPAGALLADIMLVNSRQHLCDLLLDRVTERRRQRAGRLLGEGDQGKLSRDFLADKSLDLCDQRRLFGVGGQAAE